MPSLHPFRCQHAEPALGSHSRTDYPTCDPDPTFINPDTLDTIIRPDPLQCTDGDESNGEGAESPDEFFTRINNQLAAFQGIMRAGAALIQPGFQAINKWCVPRPV